MSCKDLNNSIKTPCNFYVTTGFCSKPDYFRCIEYMVNNEPIISYSAMRNFLRCEQLYYDTNILGLERIEKSDALKIGKYVDSALNRKEVDVSGEEDVWLQKARAIAEGMHTLGITKHIVNQDFKSQKEFTIQRDGFPQIHGFIDFHHVSNKFFLELKTTSKPDTYQDKFLIEDQVGTYFLSNSDYQFCVMLIIRIPELIYNENQENLQKYYNRCLDDIVRRPRHYFIGYNYETNKFGIKFYRQEMNLDELIRRYKWTIKEIQQCAKENYWPLRKGSCFFPSKCDFYEACSIGISEDRYKKKGKIIRDHKQ